MARLGMAFFICALGVCVSPPGSPAADKPKDPAKTKPADHEEPADVHGGAGQSAFHDLWIKVAERTCVKCHNADGDASDSAFLLVDFAKVPAVERAAAMGKNLDAFIRMAKQKGDGSRTWIVVKATGGKEHGGGEVLKADSTGLRLLEEFVRSVQKKSAAGTSTAVLVDDDRRPFFDDVQMIGDQRLLRRATLSLAARLPTDAERKAVSTGGLKSLATILDAVMREDAFYERLVEAFNDIFLTRGIDDNAEIVLSYDHFEHTRHWYQKYKIENVPEKDRQKAMYKLVDQYREAMLREPLELIRHIVKEDHPFTEILTANYTMVSPYSARGYGVFEEIKGQFKNPDDPFEFIPTRIKALKGRDGKVQPTGDGLYTHSGLLTMFQYLKAATPTTETNRNRLRARMYYQQFLGVDIMNLAPRVSDAAAIGAKYKVPTMEAAECVVCHKTVDPIAGLFQDYYSEDGSYKPRKEGWFADMFGSGREGTDLPEKERWRSLQWLAELTVKDPRFAIAMTEHVYYILTGRKVLLPPDDIDDPLFAARRRAYRAQRELIERGAERLANNNFNLKVVFQELAVSPFYRADGLATAEKQPERLAELDDVGLVRMLSPEQLERKVAALFGKKWGRLEESYSVLYGGIDSKEVTERLTERAAIGSIQRILANDLACKRVADDFKLPASQRKLFPGIEIDDVPNTNNPQTEKRIRNAIVHLHQYVLGRDDKPDDPEVTATYTLFTDIAKEATARPQFEKVESYFCKSAPKRGRQGCRSELHAQGLARRDGLPLASTRLLIRIILLRYESTPELKEQRLCVVTF